MIRDFVLKMLCAKSSALYVLTREKKTSNMTWESSTRRDILLCGSRQQTREKTTTAFLFVANGPWTVIHVRP